MNNGIISPEVISK